MNTPAISVIIATANRADKLTNAIESLLSQTEKGFELLVVDCGSNDQTENVVRSFMDERIHYHYVDSRDRGNACAKAVKRSRGYFVAFMDAHSLWHSSLLKRLRNALEASSRKVGVSYTAADCFNEEGALYQSFPPAGFPQGNIARELFLAPVIAPSSMLIRREVLMPLLKQADRFWFQDDHALSIRLSALTEFVSVEETLVSLKDVGGQSARGVAQISDTRGEALMRALEEMPGIVPLRFGRRCLADYYGERAEAESAKGQINTALGSASKVLIYTPFSIRAWVRIVRLAVSRP